MAADNAAGPGAVAAGASAAGAGAAVDLPLYQYPIQCRLSPIAKEIHRVHHCVILIQLLLFVVVFHN